MSLTQNSGSSTGILEGTQHEKCHAGDRVFQNTQVSDGHPRDCFDSKATPPAAVPALPPPDGCLGGTHARRSPCAHRGRALLSETLQQPLVVRGNPQAWKSRLAGTAGSKNAAAGGHGETALCSVPAAALPAAPSSALGLGGVFLTCLYLM